MAIYREKKPEVGHYSALRTKLGNWLVGRRAGKSRVQVYKDLQSTLNVTGKKRFETSAKGATVKMRRSLK